MGKLVYTVTAAGATAGTTGTSAQTGLGLGAQNTIVSDTHPMIERWLAAAWVAQISL